MDRWVGKTAVVTGVSAGIGAAIAERLVNEGLIVVGIARRKHKLEDFAQKLEGRKGKFHAFVADVTKEADILAAFEYIRANLSPVHVVVNDAAICLPSTWIDGDTELWRRTLDTNVLGVSLVTREALRDMRQKNVAGHIININSISGHRVVYIPNAVYTPSKHAVTAMTEMLRQELLEMKLDIKVTSVSPGLVQTDVVKDWIDFDYVKQKVEERRILSPWDIVEGVVYVLSTPTHVQIDELTITPIGRNTNLE